MSVYGINYINETTNNSDDLKSLIYKYKNNIRKNTNKICNIIFTEKYKDSFNNCPTFDDIKIIDGYYWIFIKNIDNDTYSSGIGLDFERDVARELNRSELGDIFKFITEDYPGILIELR